MQVGLESTVGNNIVALCIGGSDSGDYGFAQIIMYFNQKKNWYGVGNFCLLLWCRSGEQSMEATSPVQST